MSWLMISICSEDGMMLGKPERCKSEHVTLQDLEHPLILDMADLCLSIGNLICYTSLASLKAEIRLKIMNSESPGCSIL